MRESAEFKLANVWSALIKYVAPVVLVVILIAYIMQSLGMLKL